MTEPLRAPLSISRQALPAFFQTIRTRASDEPPPFFKDDSLRFTREPVGFRLEIHAFGTQHSLTGNFVGDSERLHLDWTLHAPLPKLVVPVGGGMAVFLVLLIGLFSKDGPQVSALLWAVGFGTIIYINYRAMKSQGDESQRRFLKCVQESIDEAERVTQSTPLQSAPVPSEPTP
jgi:hypothetical protein